MVIQGKLLSYGDDLSEAYMIREKVFVEECGIPKHQEFDSLDGMAMHVIIYEAGKDRIPVATGRIIFDGSNCEMGHVAVLKEYRNRKYGDFTVRMLMNKAFTAGISDVECRSEAKTKDFFEKIGFVVVCEESEGKSRFYRMRINENDVMKECSKK